MYCNVQQHYVGGHYDDRPLINVIKLSRLLMLYKTCYVARKKQMKTNSKRDVDVIRRADIERFRMELEVGRIRTKIQSENWGRHLYYYILVYTAWSAV